MEVLHPLYSCFFGSTEEIWYGVGYDSFRLLRDQIHSRAVLHGHLGLLESCTKRMLWALGSAQRLVFRHLQFLIAVHSFYNC